MTTNQSEDEGLREQIENIVLGETPRQYFSDNMLEKPGKLMALISQKIIEARIDERDSAHRMHQREMNQLKKERDIFLKHIETHVCPMVIELPKGATLTQGIKENIDE